MSRATVLVTRPAGRNEELIAALAAADIDAVACPLLAIEALPTPTPAQRVSLQQLDQLHGLIFISANAVRCGMAWIAQYWPRLPAGLHCYTVGAGSARQLQRYGIAAEHPRHPMNSEGLLALPALWEVFGQRILIVKGCGGRGYLHEQLRARGARVEELTTYRRVRLRLAPGELATRLSDAACAALLLSSGEGLHNMVSLLSANELATVRRLPLIVPGGRVAGLARELGFVAVIEAEDAGDRAMVAATDAHLPTGGKGGETG